MNGRQQMTDYLVEFSRRDNDKYYSCIVTAHNKFNARQFATDHLEKDTGTSGTEWFVINITRRPLS